MSYEQYDPGRVVCLQYRSNDRFYFVLSGLITKIKTLDLAEGITKHFFCELHQGNSTDIYETLNGKKRQYSFICKTDVEIILLEREDLYAAFQNSECKTTVKRILKSMELFQTYPLHLLFQKRIVSVKFYPYKEIVDTDMHRSSCFYVIKTGSCKVYMNLKDVFRIKGIPTNDDKIFHRNNQNRQFCKALQALPQLEHKYRSDERYVHINTMQAGEIYGLDTLLPRVQRSVYSNVCNNALAKTLEMERYRVILISNGAECLLIDKKKFLKHADFCTISKLFSKDHQVMTLPHVERLNYALRWRVYKESVVKSVISDK